MGIPLQVKVICFLVLSTLVINVVDSKYPKKWAGQYQSGGKYEKGGKYEAVDCGAYSPCPKPYGLFPDPASCCSFYNCDKCKAYVQKCGPGTHFNPYIKNCDYPHKAGCTAKDQGCHKKFYGYKKW